MFSLLTSKYQGARKQFKTCNQTTKAVDAVIEFSCLRSTVRDHFVHFPAEIADIEGKIKGVQSQISSLRSNHRKQARSKFVYIDSELSWKQRYRIHNWFSSIMTALEIRSSFQTLPGKAIQTRLPCWWTSNSKPWLACRFKPVVKGVCCYRLDIWLQI